MARTLELTEGEADLLSDILDWWAADNEQAEDMTIDDKSLGLDELLTAHDGLKDLQAKVESIRSKLKGKCHA